MAKHKGIEIEAPVLVKKTQAKDDTKDSAGTKKPDPGRSLDRIHLKAKTPAKEKDISHKK